MPQPGRPDQRPTVLLVNPNRDRVTTALMTALAEEALRPSGVGVRGLTAAAGPSMIVDEAALAAAAEHVVNAVMGDLRGDGGAPVAVVVGAVGDPGRSALASRLAVPVVGIGQASVLAASANGRRFGMATSTPALVGSLERLAVEHGAADRLTGVRLTTGGPLELAADPARQLEELTLAVRQCVEIDGAETVIIAGGPLGDAARRIAALGIAAIVEPVPSACALVLRRLDDRAGARG